MTALVDFIINILALLFIFLWTVWKLLYGILALDVPMENIWKPGATLIRFLIFICKGHVISARIFKKNPLSLKFSNFISICPGIYFSVSISFFLFSLSLFFNKTLYALSIGRFSFLSFRENIVLPNEYFYLFYFYYFYLFYSLLLRNDIILM